MSFSEQVKPLWEKSPLTLAQLAERCSISESSASRYMNGKVVPPADVAETILHVLAENTHLKIPGHDEHEHGHEPCLTVKQVQNIYLAQIATIQTIYSGRITDLRKDKGYLYATILALFAFIVYLFVDAMNGGWGLVRYPMA